MTIPTPTPPATWLIRIAEIWAPWEEEILQNLGGVVIKRLGNHSLLIGLPDPATLQSGVAAKFVRWNLPVHHGWPCDPLKSPRFIEKAAQAMARKFASAQPQTVLVGVLDAGAPHSPYRALASNLRGRTLQLFPPHCGAIRDAETQDSRAATLFAMVGKEGLFCGLQSPAAAHGFYPGGTKFIRQNAPGTISRAGAKIAEALHHILLNRPPPAAGSHWLELGASPGGMTAELLARGYRVTAVDRAPLDERLAKSPGLQAVVADAASFRPAPATVFDAILSDMNGEPDNAIVRVASLTRHLRPGGLVVFTLKLPGAATFAAANELAAAVTARAATAGLHVISCHHLTYNRREFTLFFEHFPPLNPT